MNTKKEDAKYILAIDEFGISATQVLHKLKKKYPTSVKKPFIWEYSPTWLIEKVMIILSERK